MVTTDTTQPQEKQSWIASNWKALISMTVVVIVVLAIIGLVFTQPWSQMYVVVTNTEASYDANVAVYLDGVLKDSGMIVAGAILVWGPYNVVQASHTVGLDINFHYRYDFDGTNDFDGTIDRVRTFNVGPLYTKNAYFEIWQ